MTSRILCIPTFLSFRRWMRLPWVWQPSAPTPIAQRRGRSSISVVTNVSCKAVFSMYLPSGWQSEYPVCSSSFFRRPSFVSFLWFQDDNGLKHLDRGRVGRRFNPAQFAHNHVCLREGLYHYHILNIKYSSLRWTE